jgi:hypothetical protein
LSKKIEAATVGANNNRPGKNPNITPKKAHTNRKGNGKPKITPNPNPVTAHPAPTAKTNEANEKLLSRKADDDINSPALQEPPHPLD